MNPVAEKNLLYIRRNRVSTTEVADCLGKAGAIEGVSAVNQGMFSAGIVRYIYGHTESNWSIHEQARGIQPGEIVVMDEELKDRFRPKKSPYVVLGGEGSAEE